MSDESLFLEVEEEVRREKYKQLWKRYGAFVIGLGIVVLVGIVGWRLWSDYQQKQREDRAAAYLKAETFLEAQDTAKAAETFASLAAEAGPGYRALARMREAEALLVSGNPKGAADAYDALAVDGAVRQDMRDLANLKAALILADTAGLDEIEKRVQGLNVEGNPWRFMAWELLAYARYRAGEYKQALADYTLLQVSGGAPQDIRARAADMAGLVSSLVKPEDESAAADEDASAGMQTPAGDGNGAEEQDGAKEEPDAVAAETATEAVAETAEETEETGQPADDAGADAEADAEESADETAPQDNR